MVQTMGKGLYSMSTVVQGEKLGQFLDTEMPSMDNLKVPSLFSESLCSSMMLLYTVYCIAYVQARKFKSTALA